MNNDTIAIGYFPIQFDVVDKDGDTTHIDDTIFGYVDSMSYRNYSRDFKAVKEGKYHVTGYIMVWDDTARANDTVRFSFFVKPIPQATIVQRVVKVCKGDSAHLEITTSVPGTNIEWYATDKPGRPPVNIGKKYDYVPTGTSVGELKVWKFRIHIANPGRGIQCDYNDTITVEVYSLPKNEFTKSGDSLIAGEGEDYQWYWNGTPIAGANDQTYVPAKTGNYYVRYAVPGANRIGCKGTTTPQLITVMDTTNSVTEIGSNSGFTIYPNPGNGFFHLKWDGPAPDEILVLNTLGQQVLQMTNLASTGSCPIDISNTEKGLYLVAVKKGNYLCKFKIHKI